MNLYLASPYWRDEDCNCHLWIPLNPDCMRTIPEVTCIDHLTSVISSFAWLELDNSSENI